MQLQPKMIIKKRLILVKIRILNKKGQKMFLLMRSFLLNKLAKNNLNR